MQPTTIPLSATVAHPPQGRAHDIPALRQDEVIPMARVELERFLALLDALELDEWNLPTECTLWSVKDIVAHQASHVVGFVHWRACLDQFNPLKLRDYMRRGMNILDAANQRQVDMRADWSPEQLIAEIRDHSEAAFDGRQRFPGWLRASPLRSPGYDGWLTIGSLIDGIYTRDMWMHRLDICHATGREMVLTAAHDGRVTALVVRDLDQSLAKHLRGQCVSLHLDGSAGGTWLLGRGQDAGAQLYFDVRDFHRLASGRITAEQALNAGLAQVHGDAALAAAVLEKTVVLY
jgi:uncharacterized protein (TIGR03083 family)